MTEGYLLTEAGYHNLLRQKERLRQELEDTTRQMGREASIDNDLRENPAFMELRRRAQYTLPKQLAELDQVLANCRVLSADELRRIESHEVAFGTRVSIEDDGHVIEYAIVGYGESDPKAGLISYLSPLGSRLLGHEVGDTVTVSSARGERTVTVVAIRRLVE